MEHQQIVVCDALHAALMLRAILAGAVIFRPDVSPSSVRSAYDASVRVLDAVMQERAQ